MAEVTISEKTTVRLGVILIIVSIVLAAAVGGLASVMSDRLTVAVDLSETKAIAQSAQ